jgi:hypothetical protein
MQPQKVLKDEYLDGKRLCNLTKPYGLIYADGRSPSDAKYLQDHQYYRGDRTPIEGMTERKNDPPKVVEFETTPEDVAIAKRMEKVEADVGDLKSGVAQILALLSAPKDEKAKK